MPARPAPVPDVFSSREIARAAGVHPRLVDDLIRGAGLATVGGRFVPQPAATAAVRRLRGATSGETFSPRPFRSLDPRRATPGRGLAASAAVHLVVLAALVLVTSGAIRELPIPATPEPTRLVFVVEPGPGGGGGGGGVRQPTPPPRAEMQGRAVVRSPVPPPRRLVAARPVPRRPLTPPVRPRPVERPAEPPPPPALTEPLPQVVAPLATIAADPADRVGVLAGMPGTIDSHGPGSGGGAGSGDGTGMGEGDGSGVGPGSGGGTGGGPYRPGSGITPPSIVREVKPAYTQDARRRGIEGDVVVEIIVRADGSVGQARLVRSLGGGLDQRAIDAVRQWRFAPARRHGAPVDVVVEIAVEFRLR